MDATDQIGLDLGVNPASARSAEELSQLGQSARSDPDAAAEDENQARENKREPAARAAASAGIPDRLRPGSAWMSRPLHWTDELLGLGDNELRGELERRIAEDVASRCPRNRRDRFTAATRASHRKAQVIVHGRTVTIRIQRIERRSDGRVVDPPLYKEIVEAERKRRNWRSVQKQLSGLTTRKIRGDAELDGRSTRGLAKTTVSNAFIEQSTEALNAMMTAPLEAVSLAVVWLDGTKIGDQTVLVAVGATVDGTKLPLAVGEGDEEDPEAVKSVVRNMIERGADLRHVVWSLDRGDALRRGIKAVLTEAYGKEFADSAAIQNCTRHLTGNVREEMDKLRFDGLFHRLDQVARDQTRSGATKKLNRVIRELQAEPYGSPETNAAGMAAISTLRSYKDDLLPQTREQKRDEPRGPRHRLETVDQVHRALAAVMPNEEIATDLWAGVLGRLHIAWHTPDYDKALAQLLKIKADLHAAGDVKAAATLTNLEETLTVNSRGVHGDTLDQLNTNNIVENANSGIKAQTRVHHTPSRNPEDDVRARWAAAAMMSQLDQGAWSPVGSLEELLGMKLQQIARHYSDVELDAWPFMDAIVIWKFGAEPGTEREERAGAALDDILDLADSVGMPVAVVAEPQSRHVTEEELKEWFHARGFTATDPTTNALSRPAVTERARAAEIRSAASATELASVPEPAATTSDRRVAATGVDAPLLWLPDLLEAERNALGDRWTALITDEALRLSRTVSSMSRDWLTDRSEEVEAWRASTRSLETRLRSWLQNPEQAARALAYGGVRARGAVATRDRDDLAAAAPGLQRWDVALGVTEAVLARGLLTPENGAHLLEYRDQLQAWLVTRSPGVLRQIERDVAGSLDELAGLVGEELRNGSRYAAVKWELDLRDNLGISEAADPQGAEHNSKRLLPDDARRCLGHRRARLLNEVTTALSHRLQAVGPELLDPLADRAGDRLARLERGGALRFVSLERDLAVAASDRDALFSAGERLALRHQAIRGPFQGQARAKLGREQKSNREQIAFAVQRISQVEKDVSSLASGEGDPNAWMNRNAVPFATETAAARIVGRDRASMPPGELGYQRGEISPELGELNPVDGSTHDVNEPVLESAGREF